ncbi:MAG TPA: hypothetical protein VM370_05980 [Candidatus Thermoplasmatota archaeon]|nr:hypothetical protein [Candidatus Thermoplasmatota archaeon]
MIRAAGVALFAAGVLLVVAAAVISPSPTSSYELGEKVRAAGAVDASRVRVSAYGGSVHSYDAANDTTYLYTSVCSHSMCGPLVPVEGDHRGGGIRRPLLLRPLADELSLVPVPTPRDANETHFAFVTERSDEGLAFSAPFEPASPWPPFYARIGGIAIAAAGLGLAARRVWWATLPAAGALAGPVVASSTSWIVLVQLVGAPVGFIALVTALAQWGIQRRGWIAAAIALTAVVALASGFVALGYFPGDGGD